MTTGPPKFLYFPPVRPVLALHLCFLLRRSAVEVLWAKKLHNTELRKNARAILWVHQLRHWNQIPNAKEKKIPNFCLKNLRSRHWQLLQSDLWKSLRSCNSKPWLQWSPKHTVEYLFFSSFMSSHECIKRARGVRHSKLNVKEDLDSSL